MRGIALRRHGRLSAQRRVPLYRRGATLSHMAVIESDPPAREHGAAIAADVRTRSLAPSRG